MIMPDTFKKFVINILILSFIITAIGAVLFTGYLSKYYLPVFPYVLVFYLGLNILVFYVLLKSSQFRPARFVSNFMMMTGIKLFAYLAFLVIYVFSDKPHAVTFLLTFLILYVVFTVFEVVAVLHYLKKLK
jgi:hypothetical protein